MSEKIKEETKKEATLLDCVAENQALRKAETFIAVGCIPKENGAEANVAVKGNVSDVLVMANSIFKGLLENGEDEAERKATALTFITMIKEAAQLNIGDILVTSMLR